MKKDNRRRHGRVRCDGVTCDLGEILDVSASGLLIGTGRTKIPIGTKIALVLNGPDGPILVHGVVLRCDKGRRGYELGLQFQGLSRETMRGLATIARIGATKMETLRRAS